MCPAKTRQLPEVVANLRVHLVSDSIAHRRSAAFDMRPAGEHLTAMSTSDQSAAVAALTAVLRPHRIAVVGASRSRSSIGGLVFHNILAGGFTGTVYPVNPHADSVQSVMAYPSLDACPAVPDLVVVCVPATAVEEVIASAGRLGVPAVCVISAGFAESGTRGIQRQKQSMDLARRHGMRVVGPNCMGVANGAHDVRLNATFSRVFPAPGHASLYSQSGAMGLAALQEFDRVGLGIASFVSTGNTADLTVNDALLHWENDPETNVILLYLESLHDPREFGRIARRVSRSKPVIAVKAGRSPAGRRAASSHTAALATGEVPIDALFRQAGVIRVNTIEDLFGVARVLAMQPPSPGLNVGIVTNGGGPGIMAADTCEAHGLQVPTLSEATRRLLSSILPPEAAASNPVDTIASSSAAQFEQVLTVVGQADEIDAIISVFIPPITTTVDDAAAAIISARRAIPAHKPIVAVLMSSGHRHDLTQASIPTFSFPEDAARALAKAATWAQWSRQPEGIVLRPSNVDPDAVRATRTRLQQLVSQPDGDGWLDLASAQELLAAYGIPFVRSLIVTTPDEAAVAQRSAGGPVAVKLAAAIHKSDVGGVRLGINAPQEAADAVDEIRNRLIAGGLGVHATTFVVQEMAESGVEMAVGISHDPLFGQLLMVGMAEPCSSS